MISETIKNEVKYSKTLAGFFCSIASALLFLITVICNPSLDIWTIVAIFKKVLPAGIIFWILGYMAGKLLEKGTVKIIKEKKINEIKAYEMPSMFAGTGSDTIELETEDTLNEI